MFALEVPEIAAGEVEIVAIAREAGHRTKIAVRSHRQGVNAKGACIGPMGSRVRNVMNELHGEKIDIVDYSDDPAGFVANALSPARVSRVHVVDAAAREAMVIVPDYQLSLAIGKEGQNARLAARLTGWRIDIKSETQFAEEGRRPPAEPAPTEPVAEDAAAPAEDASVPVEAGGDAGEEAEAEDVGQPEEATPDEDTAEPEAAEAEAAEPEAEAEAQAEPEPAPEAEAAAEHPAAEQAEAESESEPDAPAAD